jgi:hypothetical protein
MFQFRAKIFFFFIVFSLSFFVNKAEAGTYWVSPTGTATWTNCQSATPLSGVSACSRATANTNATAGDIVYFRGGTYTVTGTGLDSAGIDPTNSGTDASHMITFSAYSNETPIITGGGITWGIYLSGDSYIKIVGFTFQDISTWAYLIKSSSYNEIASSTFTSTPGNEAGGGITISGTLSCPGLNCWNTHNWFHDNTFSKRLTTPCGEGANIFTIGQAYGAGNTVNNDNYNTIENNTIAYSAHGGMENNSMYTVIRNNYFHNEPWISGCTNYQGGTSNTSLTISTANQTLTVTDAGTLSLTVDAPIGIIYASDYSKAMSGLIQSYNSGTGQLVVRNVKTTGSGTYSNWILSQKNVPYYTNASYNGLYGHRNIQLGDDYARNGTYVLLEGNRIGHASNNPGNGGPTNLDLASPRNIVRYNDIFNGMASGIYFKYSNSAWWSGGNCTTSRVGNNGACGGLYNRVYNNTIYHNGYGDNWRIYGNMNNAYNGEGIAQWDFSGTGPTGNVIKNNIVYDNAEGDICQLTLHDTACTPETWDTLTNNWTTANGDPKFTSTDLSDATSATLPNLSLQSNSTALNGGTYLTQANGSGSNSSTLIVDDALYFQDGSWGSDLNRGINFFPDWIAIGNVNNVVQISSIDYSTNTITLASNATWSDNDPVWLYKKSDGTRVLYESAPEYGAHEYNVSTVAPTVTTSQPNNVSNSSITLNANISALGGEASTNKGFAYGTASDLSTVIATTSLGAQTETGAFSQSITGLSGNTTYYFRAYAVNSAGTSTGSILSTTTSLDPTPTPTATPAPSGGGGGGSSGGSTSVWIINGVTTTPMTVSQIATTTCTAVYPVLSKNLSLGSFGSDVYILQRLLMDEKVLIASSTSMKFDGVIQDAVATYQKKFSIVSYGSPSTTGFGVVGPKTRAFMNAKLSSGTYKSIGQCLFSTNQQILQKISTTTIFNRVLKLGSSGADVKALQIFLNNNGFIISVSGPGSKGNETQYFGPATKNALIKFQEFYGNEILLPSGLAKGTGNLGPATIKKIKELNLKK